MDIVVILYYIVENRETIIVNKIEVLTHERFAQQTNFERLKELASLRNQYRICSQWAAHKGREISNGES